MTTPDSARKFLVSVLGFIRERKLLVAAIAVVLGIGLSWLIHLPTGYSGRAHPSQAISTDFSSGFSVAWEMTSKDLGVDGPIAATTRVDGVLVAVTGKKDGSSKGATTFSGTLIGIDPRFSFKKSSSDFSHGSVIISGEMFYLIVEISAMALCEV